MKGLPDQGIEADPGKPGEKKRKRDDEPKKTPKSDKKEQGGPALKKCLVCGERHTPICALPANFRKNQREKEKAAKAAKKAERRPPRKGETIRDSARFWLFRHSQKRGRLLQLPKRFVILLLVVPLLVFFLSLGIF